MKLKVDLTRTDISPSSIEEMRKKAREAIHSLRKNNMKFSGWVNLPQEYDKEELANIIATAKEIQDNCTMMIIIGIGGSYLGARAVIEALSYPPSKVKIRYAGNNLSGSYHRQLLEDISNEEICLCVISKSGTTTESAIAYSVLKELLIEKYGAEEASKRIYAITDAHEGSLREEAFREGYKTFTIPTNIGGRYSVLTPVGLLPMAVAGIDIQSVLDGALSACTDEQWEKDLPDYAICRYLLEQQGLSLEVFEYYEPSLQYFVEWLKQLFGESCGKNGRGLFPTSLAFSTDLHSLGQFLQEGRQIFFETILDVTSPAYDVIIPKSAGPIFADRSMNDINSIAVRGVIAAHREINIPIIKVDLPELTPFIMGYMLYFFEMSCTITAILMEVNPFDQPGVENYKTQMKAELNK